MMRHCILVSATICVLTVALFPLGNGRSSVSCQTDHEGHTAISSATGDTLFQLLPGSGKKCWINDTTYFTYKFAKKPKLGTAILKIQLFNKKGEKLTHLDITGKSDMPSMRGAHDSGDVAFKQNKKGEYLLPVNIVMPGGWEVRLSFRKGQEVVFRGRLTFDV